MKNRIGFLRIFATYATISAIFIIGTIVGNRAVTVFNENKAADREHTIIVDPGHGGEDGGAVSRTGINESKYNLEIALKTNEMLKLLGYKTLIIRTDDVSLSKTGDTVFQRKSSDLKERARIVNTTSNPILVSIHQNFFEEEKYYGAQVFYGKGSGSEELAEKMQSSMRFILNPNNKRKAKESKGIYLLEKVNCPAILVECGFISNYAEEARLQDEAYQKAIAEVIAATIAFHIKET